MSTPKVHIIFLLTLVLLWSCAPKTESVIEWISIEKAQELTVKDHKKILVTVVSDNCDYSKNLESEVLSDSGIQSEISKYYHAVKMHAGSEQIILFNGVRLSENEFVKEHGVRSYPTILFFDGSGELVLQISGNMPVTDFSNILVYIGEEAYNKTEFHEFASER